MTHFNIHRFGRLLRADIITNRKQHLSVFLTVFAASLLVLFFTYYKPTLYGWQTVAPTHELAGVVLSGRAVKFFVVFLIVFMGLNLSSTFAHLVTKQQRISYVMLPASNLEKFLSRLLQHVVLFTLYVLAGIILADLVRVAVFPLFGDAYPSALPELFRGFPDIFAVPDLNDCAGNYTEFWGALLVYLIPLAGYLSFLAGSALFRRRAFVYTVLAQFLFSFFLGFMLAGDLKFRYGISDTRFLLDLLPVFCLLVLLFCVGCVWWSYRRIARLQVIPRRGWLTLKKK